MSSRAFDLAGIVKASTAASELIGGELSGWRPAGEGAPAALALERELLRRP